MVIKDFKCMRGTTYFFIRYFILLRKEILEVFQSIHDVYESKYLLHTFKNIEFQQEIHFEEYFGRLYFLSIINLPYSISCLDR